MSDTEIGYSEAALRKQAEADRKIAAGERLTFMDMFGIFEPATTASDDERCRCCGLDARPGLEYGGGDGTHCNLCIGRGHDEATE